MFRCIRLEIKLDFRPVCVCVYREAKKQTYMYATLFALSQSITYVLYSIAFKYGSFLVLQDEMTPSAVYRSVR